MKQIISKLPLVLFLSVLGCAEPSQDIHTVWSIVHKDCEAVCKNVGIEWQGTLQDGPDKLKCLCN